MICDGLGRPLTFFLSPGQMSDAKGALALLRDLPPARTLLADKGYDADWFRQALEDRAIAACIPARRGRRNPASHDRKFYRQRHRIENLLAHSRVRTHNQNMTVAAMQMAERKSSPHLS